MPGAPPLPISRPGGRSARVRAAVHRAVEELLAEGGMPAVTFPAVAERSGVHPSTIYRRWSDVGELLSAVTLSRFTGDLVVPETGSLRGDLEHWLASVAADLSDEDSVALTRAAIGAGSAETAGGCVADRRAQLEAMLDQERSRGGAPPALQRAQDQLLAPLYYRTLFTQDSPHDAAWLRGLVAAVLDQS